MAGSGNSLRGAGWRRELRHRQGRRSTPAENRSPPARPPRALLSSDEQTVGASHVQGAFDKDYRSYCSEKEFRVRDAIAITKPRRPVQGGTESRPNARDHFLYKREDELVSNCIAVIIQEIQPILAKLFVIEKRQTGRRIKFKRK